MRAWCREWLTLGNCRGGPCVRHQQIDRARADGRHLKGAAHALFVVRQPRRRSSRATMPTSTSSRACTKSNPTPRNTLSAAKLHDKKKKKSLRKASRVNALRGFYSRRQPFDDFFAFFLVAPRGLIKSLFAFESGDWHIRSLI